MTTLIGKAAWMLNEFIVRGPLSFKEVAKAWEPKFGDNDGPLIKRTFHNYINRTIPDTFEIDIDLIKKPNPQYKYDISDRSALETGPTKNLLQLILATQGIKRTPMLKERIIFAHGENEEKFFSIIADTIEQNKVIRICMGTGTRAVVTEHEVEPFYLKEYNDQWYLIGHRPVPFLGPTTDVIIDKLSDIGTIDILDKEIDQSHKADVDYIMSRFIGIPEPMQPSTILRLAVSPYAKGNVENSPLKKFQINSIDFGDYLFYDYDLDMNESLFLEIEKLGNAVFVVEPKDYHEIKEKLSLRWNPNKREREDPYLPWPQKIYDDARSKNEFEYRVNQYKR